MRVLLQSYFGPSTRSWFRSFAERGHETGAAEDLAQDVMLTVYRKAGQTRDHQLFRAWLFRVARNPACRYFGERSRQVPTVDLADIAEVLPAANHNPLTPASEFKDWVRFLDLQERETMTLRFAEEMEHHEIAAVQAVPIGTVQWRVFNSKKKLAPHLSVHPAVLRNAA